MNIDEQKVIDIWDTFKDYIPEKQRDTAANQFLDFLLDQDVNTDFFESLKGYDPHLDQAIDLVLEEIDNPESEYDWDESEDDDSEDY